LKNFWVGITILALACGCKEDEPDAPVVSYDPTPYQLDYGYFPEPFLPPDNPLTEQGVHLGKMLFYEPLLSKNNIQTCNSCHNQNNFFSDTAQFSIGVNGQAGLRHSMPIFNMAYHSQGFFWDGRADLLRHQVPFPIEDSLEMDETMENVLGKLSAKALYRDQFKRAFNTETITEEYLALALEQFMLSISSYESKYDRVQLGLESFTESEERGLQIFNGPANCDQCHVGVNFENRGFENNGLDAEEDMLDYGRELATGDPNDRGKFKVPSLRNVSLTAPYMHDGRFQTLEEVVEFYNSEVVYSPTINPFFFSNAEGGLGLSEQDKEDLVNFMMTLTDESFPDKEEYQSPF